MNSTLTRDADTDLDMITKTRPKRPRARRRTKAVRLSDVAGAAGVSTATVSMVVNGNPRISSTTQKRVRRAIERLGYRPNRAAQRLTGRGSPCLMVLLPAQRQAFADSYFGELISGITERAAAMGQVVQFEHATPEMIRAGHHVSLLQQQSADGMLLVGFNDLHSFLEDFDEVANRVILVDSRVSRADLDSVTCDYRGGAMQAMNYLLQLGHRRIGLIGSSTRGEITDGYRAAMKHHGVAIEAGWMVDGMLTEAGGDEAAAKILKAHDVTAILAASDRAAIGALHAAQRLGMSVPRDLSIVGFDNLRHAAFMNPSLTTVQLPLHEAGALACQRLVERIHDSAHDSGRRVNDRLPTHLIVRNSTSLARDLATGSASTSAA